MIEFIIFAIIAVWEIYRENHYTKEQQQIADNQRETARICEERFGGRK